MECNYFCVCLVKSWESPEVPSTLLLAGAVLMNTSDVPGGERRLGGISGNLSFMTFCLDVFPVLDTTDAIIR